MDQQTETRKVPELGGGAQDHPWLRGLLDSLDSRLRQREHVFEYSNSPECVFRAQVAPGHQDVLLVDGTRLRPGDCLVNLHWWNEQLPRMPKQGPTLAWARQMDRSIHHSLCELARHLVTRRDLAGVRGISANISVGVAEQSQQLARIMARYGFEWIAAAEPTGLRQRMHRFGENILISMIVMAHNPAAVRHDTLNRSRTLVYISRRSLERRYGELQTAEEE